MTIIIAILSFFVGMTAVTVFDLINSEYLRDSSDYWDRLQLFISIIITILLIGFIIK